ncbi:hypothetical protein K3N28_05130 [Glycomyces sp. TRM65418]|uniref:hypothetical protein n=1 Tax=Glycomyces sp. TRM65418 TaxID=2867006 RepID=UPI001CE591E7|nr:hypothetical protein [Glycomyces sp. TRM65418]MCC3762451.1 hypothetical protein [Glycomyces sp. TRM65418]QZD56495.1 hypothetical protein K3N28_05090 [Glycomyces sp. TRM65418]
MNDERSSLPAVPQLTFDSVPKQQVGFAVANYAQFQSSQWRDRDDFQQFADGLPQDIRDRIGTLPETAEANAEFERLVLYLEDLAVAAATGREYANAVSQFSGQIFEQVGVDETAPSGPLNLFYRDNFLDGPPEDQEPQNPA